MVLRIAVEAERAIGIWFGQFALASRATSRSNFPKNILEFHLGKVFNLKLPRHCVEDRQQAQFAVFVFIESDLQ